MTKNELKNYVADKIDCAETNSSNSVISIGQRISLPEVLETIIDELW